MSKNGILDETGTSYDQNCVCSDNLGKIFGVIKSSKIGYD